MLLWAFTLLVVSGFPSAQPPDIAPRPFLFIGSRSSFGSNTLSIRFSDYLPSVQRQLCIYRLPPCETMQRSAVLFLALLPACALASSAVASRAGLRLSGGEQSIPRRDNTPPPGARLKSKSPHRMNSPHRLLRSESPARGDNAKMKSQQGAPLIRIKSFGELSSSEYQDLVSKLWEAAGRGDVRACAELVKQGAWPNHLRVGKGLQASALHLAAANNHPELCAALVRLGADVDTENNQKLTALHMAAQLGHLKVVKALLSLGADPKLQDWMGDTPLDKAELAGWDDISLHLKRVAAEDSASRLQFRHNVKAMLAGRALPDDRFFALRSDNPLLPNL